VVALLVKKAERAFLPLIIGKLVTFAKKAYLVIEPLLISITKAVPDRILVRIKSNTQIIGKMDYRRCNIFLNIDSEIEYNTRLYSCEKETETVQWIETFFKEGQVFYDVGSNIGAYSLVASKFLKGHIQVYAFEPSFVTYPQLCKNISLNDCQETIMPMQIALSDQTGIENFNYNNLIPGGALHALGESIDYKGDVFEPVYKQPILAYRLDDLIRLFHIPLPNHIKIDVDGIEFKVLKGAEHTLRDQSVKSVIVELEDEDDEANTIIEFLGEKGLKFSSKDTSQYKTCNYLFCRT